MNEQVGEWTCPHTPPEDFADQVRAIVKWLGGYSGDAYVIWESNAGPGTNFGRRLQWQGHRNLYTQRAEEHKLRKKGTKYGWHSNRSAKRDLLAEFVIALTEGMRKRTGYRSCIIHSAELLEECSDYVYLESGEIEASSRADL
ncbi:MAG: hypothetical protein JRJ78_17010, partial [Deltaproteobacteria bacterium]|nr:hypothetical protein [Deltaproteobacteria bacterium]